MGRYISNAIITDMTIYRGKDSHVFKDDAEFISSKEEILSEIGKEFNLDLFNIKYYNNAIELTLKEQILKDNLFDLIREFSHYVYHDYICILYELGIDENNFFDDKNFDESKYQISLDHGRDWKGNIDRKSPITIYCNDNQCQSMSSVINTYQYAMFEPDFKYFNSYPGDINIYCSGVNLWLAIDKYDGEDATEFLRLLNLFSRKVIQNPLGNVLLYHINE